MKHPNEIRNSSREPGTRNGLPSTSRLPFTARFRDAARNSEFRIQNSEFIRARRAFTLIELLIVVAIIAILAAIAVPNFLEAQIRSKVARAKSDMRTLATGFEQYAVDHNGYPDIFTRLTRITTPVQYLTTIPSDPFRQVTASNRSWRRGWYRFGAMPIDRPSRYAIDSVGPDTDIDTYFNDQADNEDDSVTDWEPNNQALRLYPGYHPTLFSTGYTPPSASSQFLYVVYDPTNGTVTNGDLFRLSDHSAL